MRVAFIHEWLSTYAGSEQLLEQMLDLFPHADVFCIVDFLPAAHRDFLKGRSVRTSFIQKLPRARSKFRNYLPLMPLAVEQFDLSSYDLVISNSHAVAKGVLTSPHQLHLCMCLSPIRYAWDLQQQYLSASGLQRGMKGWLVKAVLHYIRMWDVRSANRVDHFMAISKFIARRVRKYYRREATVIYPPVDTEAFPLHTEKEDFYLTASRMTPYKRMDLITESFSLMPDKKLIVIGDGPDRRRVRSNAASNVQFLGHVDRKVLIDHMQRAKAFIFAAEEDFGMVVVEAQACGTPVITFGRGGATEIVIDGQTGVHFAQQTAPCIAKAVQRFESQASSFDPQKIRANAERFSIERFRSEFTQIVDRQYAKFKQGLSE